MRVITIAPPAPLLPLADVKAHLRVDDDGEDDLIADMLAAACGHIDGQDGWIGRAIGVQSIELRLDRFARSAVQLPLPPIIAIDSIKYLDGGGVEQTVAAENYERRGAEIGTAWGASWPTARCQAEAVRIRYRAGYVVDAGADPLVAAVPAPIRAAIRLMIEDLYKNRGSTIVGKSISSVPMSTTVENLLAPYRVWG